MAVDTSPSLKIVQAPRPKGGRLNDQVYGHLKNEILLCHLEPGAEISEGMLAQRYAFSKAPIRNALGRLRQEHFVVTRGRLGNMVAPITLQDVREVFQLRLLLEVEATRLAAGRVDAELLRDLEAHVRATHASEGASARETYREANHALHSYIARASGSNRLAAMVIALIEQHERIIHFSLSIQNRDAEFHHVHDSLVDALIDGNSERAAEIVEAAIRGSQARIIEAFLSEAAPGHP